MTGARRILSIPRVYDLVQNVLGAQRVRREFVRRYLRVGQSQQVRILDVGCGTAEILPHLPACSYVGVDLSASYIDAAKARFGERGSFYCLDVTDPEAELPKAEFDVAVMTGLLHHLPDDAMVKLLSSVGRLLAPGGRVVTIDPTIAPETHPFGRLLASKDRGQHVRSPSGYRALAERAYGGVVVHVRHDLLLVPYSHAVLECSQPLPAGS